MESNVTLCPAADEPCRLDECPPGLFLFEGTLGFKSEYADVDGGLDVYCCDSGEYFWGGHQHPRRTLRADGHADGGGAVKGLAPSRFGRGTRGDERNSYHRRLR
jgi:hypothetical protein